MKMVILTPRNRLGMTDYLDVILDHFHDFHAVPSGIWPRRRHEGPILEASSRMLWATFSKMKLLLYLQYRSILGFAEGSLEDPFPGTYTSDFWIDPRWTAFFTENDHFVQ